MPSIDAKAFRTIIAASLTTTALIEGLKECVKKQKKKDAKLAEEPEPKEQLSEKKSASSANSSNSKSRASGTRNPSSAGTASAATEPEGALDRLDTLELYAWLPTAMSAFEEITLNKWIPAIHPPADVTTPFFNSLVLIRDDLHCRNPHELASALVSIADCFADSAIPWDTYIELDSTRYVKLKDLFWGPRGIGRPEKFWMDAYRANKALPQINPAELAILTVMESQGYDKPIEKGKVRVADEAVQDPAREPARERVMKDRKSVV